MCVRQSFQRFSTLQKSIVQDKRIIEVKASPCMRSQNISLIDFVLSVELQLFRNKYFEFVERPSKSRSFENQRNTFWLAALFADKKIRFVSSGIPMSKSEITSIFLFCFPADHHPFFDDVVRSLCRPSFLVITSFCLRGSRWRSLAIKGGINAF